MSMLEEGSVIITGGSLESRKSCAGEIIATPNVFAKIAELTLTDRPNLSGSVSEIPENDPDVVNLSHEKEKISVVDVRAFLALLKIKPIARSQKIGLILEAQDLTIEAQNALLKTLEEPPKSCLILLTVSHPKKLLPTTLSRCLLINLGEEVTGEKKITDLEISALSVGDKFALAQKVGASRLGALDFLDSLFLWLHKSLILHPEKANFHFEKIAAVKKIISGNGNVRLTLENLFLDW